jgi:hypothetical protein
MYTYTHSYAHVKLNPGLPWPKQHSVVRRLFFFATKLDFTLKKKLLKFEELLFTVLKIGQFGKYIINSWTVLKCGAGEGWRRLFGPIV